MLEPGSAAPTITLPATIGDNFVLEAGCGRLVVYFYPRDDTPGCTNEAIDFSALRDEFSALGVQIVGISPDPVQKHHKFRDKHGLTVNLASDEDNAVARAFGVWVEKNMYGKKYMGVERATFLIDENGVIREIWRKVKVKGHAEAVLHAARTHFG